MKTSNKILAGFFIVVFLVPVFMLMSFNNKIKKGQFTVVKQEIYEGADFRSGNFKSYKVVKIMAPSGRIIKCNLQYSDSLYYSYNKMETQDSVMVYNEGDTVFVKYFNPNATMPDNSTIHLNLELPAIQNLVVENAEITLDSIGAGANKDLAIEVYGTSLVNIGRAIEEKNREYQNAQEFPYQVSRLSLKMKEGEVVLGNRVDIGQLNLQLDGAAGLTINDGAAIGEMHGSLSGQSSVKASWKYVKRLAALTKE
ncbi:MAG: hypothetical protein ACXWC7_02065 [Chitinophagaceae bacterium]